LKLNGKPEFEIVSKYYFLWDPEQGSIALDAISHLKGSFEAHDINNKGQIIGTQYSKPGQGPDRVIIFTPESKSKTREE
jgi:hypothetical protein